MNFRLEYEYGINFEYRHRPAITGAGLALSIIAVILCFYAIST
jgi:hypothetical protein